MQQLETDMTTQTVLTLTEDQLRLLHVAMETFLAVGAHADSLGNGQAHQSSSFNFARRTVNEAFAATRWDPLRIRATHQGARDLLELLELAESIELRATDVPAAEHISDEPIGFEAAFVESAQAAYCRS